MKYPMNLAGLVQLASDKTQFTTLTEYLTFCELYLTSVQKHVQAVIVAQNETQYQFFQYKGEGHFNITRPINGDLMFGPNDVSRIAQDFLPTLRGARDLPETDTENRALLLRSIYTVQQCIGAALDALPAGESNRARKVNGDLFERFIQLLIRELSVDCSSGTVLVPVIADGQEQFAMSYQHDLLIKAGDELKAIGSVKTSSKGSCA